MGRYILALGVGLLATIGACVSNELPGNRGPVDEPNDAATDALTQADAAAEGAADALTDAGLDGAATGDADAATCGYSATAPAPNAVPCSGAQCQYYCVYTGTDYPPNCSQIAGGQLSLYCVGGDCTGLQHCWLDSYHLTGGCPAFLTHDGTQGGAHAYAISYCTEGPPTYTGDKRLCSSDADCVGPATCKQATYGTHRLGYCD